MSSEIPAFDSEKLNTINAEKVVYKSINGQNLEYAICYPEIEPKGVALFIHGGGWRSDDLNRLLPHAKYAAFCGAVGVSVDYRLNGETTDVRDGLKDCADALNHIRKTVREKYGKDLQITALGDSAGGYYAVCSGSQKVLSLADENAKIVDFVVDLNGIVDLTGKWSCGIKTDEQTAKKYSPLYNVAKGDAPVLIMHGDEDKTVDIADAFAYEKALKEKGVECETRIIHGAAHAFILFDYRRDNKLVAETLRFVIKKLFEKWQRG